MSQPESAQQILDRLKAPVLELRILLDFGYRRGHALRFVGEHHQLGEWDRNVLERVVFSQEAASRRRARLVGPGQLKGASVVVDGYNVLISLECLFAGEPLFLADDGVVRDVAARRGLRHRAEAVDQGLRHVLELFKAQGVAAVTLIFDQQVSRSGELAATCRAALGRHNFMGEARTELRADHALIDAAKASVVCTSDRVIIDAAPRAFDLVNALAKRAVAVGEPPVGRLKIAP